MLQKQYGFIVLMQILFLVLKPFTIIYGTNFKIYKTFNKKSGLPAVNLGNPLKYSSRN